eukprot:1577601-Amphidinium_carterae.1
MTWVLRAASWKCTLPYSMSFTRRETCQPVAHTQRNACSALAHAYSAHTNYYTRPAPLGSNTLA